MKITTEYIFLFCILLIVFSTIHTMLLEALEESPNQSTANNSTPNQGTQPTKGANTKEEKSTSQTKNE